MWEGKIRYETFRQPIGSIVRHLEIREGGDKLEEKFSVFKEEEEDGMVSQR